MTVTTIKIRTYQKPEVFEIDYSQFFYVEDVIFHLLTDKFELFPTSIHLFGLFNVKKDVYLAPNFKFRDILTHFDKQPEFWLRLRFLPTDSYVIMRSDLKAFSYYFSQVQHDYKHFKDCENYENDLYGISIMGVVIDVLSSKIPFDIKNMGKYVEKVFDDLPERMTTSFIKKIIQTQYRRDKIKNTLLELFDSGQESDMLKRHYINQFVCELNCCDESFKVTYSLIGTSRENGLKKFIKYRFTTGMLSLESFQDKRVSSDLYDLKKVMEITVSKQNNCTVSLSIYDSPPNVFHFTDHLKSLSFVSLLSGYYRLRYKWNRQLCDSVYSPWLVKLNEWFCHGPVGFEFARNKLEKFNESLNSDSFFIFFQDNQSFQKFHLYSLNKEYNLELRKIENNELFFYFKEDDRKFYKPHDFIEYFLNKTRTNLLTSKDNDLPLSLMHCRDSSMNDQSKNEPKLPIIHAEQLEESQFFFRNNHQFTTHYGIYDPLDGKNKRVPVMLKHFNLDIHTLEQHQSLMAKWVKLSDESIVNCLGILIHPFTMVSEKCQTSLEELFRHKQSFKPHHLAQAGYFLARALDYLNSSNFVHGHIRFENIYVDYFSNSMLRVKLGDPVGMMHIYRDEYRQFLQRPWLPPEYYDMNDSLGGKLTSYCDIWSYGTTLYQIYHSCRLPKINGPIFFDSSLPPNIHQVIESCWFKDYKIRIQSSAIYNLLSRVVNSFNDVINQYEEIQTNVVTVENTNPSQSVYVATSKVQSSMQHSNGNCNSSEIFNEQSTSEIKRRWFPGNIFRMRRSSSGTSINTTITETTTLCNVSDCSSVYNFGKTEEGFSNAKIPWEEIELKKPIGEGKFGKVFLAEHHGNDVAIKLISQKGHNNFQYEIEILFKLKHKNIVKILGFTNINNDDMENDDLKNCSGMGMVVEYMALGSLEKYLSARLDDIIHGSKYQVPFVKFALDIAEGLLYLKEKDIVHRDLAARNILVCTKDHVKISDFGLSLILAGKEDLYSASQLTYLPYRTWPPETIIPGKKKFTHLSDVWSYGILLWEMFDYCKTYPFFEIGQTDLASKLYEYLRNDEHRPKIPSECPTEIYDIMTRCWKWNPEERTPIKAICEELRIINSRSTFS